MKKKKPFIICTVQDKSGAVPLFPDRSIMVTGKEATTLHHLIKAGGKGITALEMSNTWALRLAAYVHRLRSLYSFNIDTVREEHEDGHHGRYILRDNLSVSQTNIEG